MCNQRMDQLRRRFDSGLNLDELLASPKQEEQTIEVSCIPLTHHGITSSPSDETTT